MIDRLSFLRGPIRHMFRIGQHEEHKALRARNEARLAALKASKRLYEDKRERPATYNAALNLSAEQRCALDCRPARNAFNGGNPATLNSFECYELYRRER